jgi:hypothetical protein
MMNDLRPLAHGRVRELVDILSEFSEDDGEDEGAEPGPAGTAS